MPTSSTHRPIAGHAARTRPWRRGLLLAGLVICAAGCRLPVYRGPGSRAVMTSRQLTQQGAAAFDRQDLAAAESLFSQAVAACPNDVEAKRQYAETLWRRGARQEAIGQLAAATQVAPEDPTLLVRLADMRLASGQSEQARRDVEAAIDLDPRSPDAWLTRARVMRQAGDPSQQLADLHRALAYDPRHPQVLRELAAVYLAQNQPERALANLQTLLDQHAPGDEPQDLLYEVGRTYAGLGRFDDAAETFQVALARGQPSAELFFRLSEAEALRGRPAEARAALLQAAALDPRNPAYQQLLARLPQAPAVAGPAGGASRGQ